jgi:Uma2 family endonuclease
MAPATSLVTVEEYLATDYMPNAEYVDGVVVSKSMPTLFHGFIQLLLCSLVNARYPELLAIPELGLRLSPSRVLIPDIGVQAKSRLQGPHASKPIFLCVEILSPDDRITKAFLKCEAYLSWGVPFTWIIDPDSQRAWTYSQGTHPVEVPPQGSLCADAVSIPLADLFSQLPVVVE